LIERLAAVRLLTLTGAGGIGKTRLAVELARQLLHRFPDGIWLVDLAPLSDPDMIPRAVAAELRLTEQHGRSLTDTVAAYLRDRRVLLMLDNCERVVDAGADFALALLSRCSGLKILATSRQRLGMAGEQVWPVPSLTVPDEVSSTEQLLTFEAMQLLLDRATLVRWDFSLNDANAQALVQVCRRLDGIPLALELAAARMASFPPNEIADRLDDRFNLLATHERGRPARHQTLQAALEWSHHLLDQQEQVLFRRLGVFNGGFDLEAVGAVCLTAQDSPQMAERVTPLVEKSLVLRGGADPTRFWMLETMREFARNRAATTSDNQWLGRKHAEHFLNVLRMHGGKLRSKGARLHLAHLDRNIDNIRTALDWANANDRELLARLVLGLHAYWTSRCAFREALIWVRLALDGQGSALRQPLLASAGWLELTVGEVNLGFDHSRQALAAAEASGDSWGQVRALFNVAEAAASLDDLDGTKRTLERAVAIAESVKTSDSGSFQDQALRSGAWCMLAWVQMIVGEPEVARASVLRGTELAAQAGDYFCEALGHAWHSEIAMAEGDLSNALNLARRGLELGVNIDHRFVMVRGVGQLAAIAAENDLPDRALRLAAAVDSVRSATGARGFEKFDFWFGWGWPGRLQRVRDRLGPEEAKRIWDEGSRLSVYDAAAVALGDQTLISHSTSAPLSSVH
jgi:predicted ATPase